MGERKLIKIPLFPIILIVLLLVIIVIACYIYMNKAHSDNKITNSEITSTDAQEQIENIPETSDDSIQTNAENILLYNGIEISKESGIQNISDIRVSTDSIKKYNTTYYNYENGKYEGITTGIFGEQSYEGYSIVQNVKKIAMSKQYNAIPRTYSTTSELPEQLIDMADCSSVNIDSIDLDGDNNIEHIVCYTVNYARGEIGDGEPQASSGIMLLDSNYKKIADLVTLENGFWAGIKEENYKRFLSLDNVEYIDIDNNGIMEIIIEVPTYEGTKISILKYSNNKVEGEINLQANLLP